MILSPACVGPSLFMLIKQFQILDPLVYSVWTLYLRNESVGSLCIIASDIFSIYVNFVGYSAIVSCVYIWLSSIIFV